MSKPQDAFTSVIESWLKSKPVLVYCISLGAFLFVLLWLDFKVLQFDLSNVEVGVGSLASVIFVIASTFVLIPILALICQAICVYVKIINLRKVFPLKEVDNQFSLVNFKGKVYLVDHNKKIMRWIQTWQTAIDLRFTEPWTDVDINLNEPNIFASDVIVYTKEGIQIKLRDYHKEQPIYTRDSFPI